MNHVTFEAKRRFSPNGSAQLHAVSFISAGRERSETHTLDFLTGYQEAEEDETLYSHRYGGLDSDYQERTANVVAGMVSHFNVDQIWKGCMRISP